VYAWIWRHLPGPTWLRALILVVAAALVVLLLFLVVFPWLSPRLPFTDTTIEAFGAYGWGSTGGST
jgi:hypothetical protein